MKSHPWNISKSEGETLLNKLLLDILHQKSFLAIDQVGNQLKIKASNQNLLFKKNRKHRNINHFIRSHFKGLQNFIETHPDLYQVKKKDVYYHIALQPMIQTDLNKKEAEDDDFIWVENELEDQKIKKD